MYLLFPRLSLHGAVALLTAFAACMWGYDPTIGVEVLYSIDPVTAGILVGGAVIAGAAPGIIEGAGRKKGIKKTKETAEYKALQKESRAARKRLKEGKYGMSAAQKRGMMTEAVRAQEAATRQAEADLRRQAAVSGGFARSGRQAAAIGSRQAQAAQTAAGASGAAEKLSQQMAAQQRAADIAEGKEAYAREAALIQGKAQATAAQFAGAAKGVGAGLTTMGQHEMLAPGGAFRPNAPTQAAAGQQYDARSLQYQQGTGNIGVVGGG